MTAQRQTLVALGLVGLSSLTQVWWIARAHVPAQDAVRYVAAAQSMAQSELSESLAADREQPLYPWLVWQTWRGLKRLGFIDDSQWALAAQVAAAVPLIVGVVPMYLMLTTLVGAGAAALGGLLYCMLPAVARLGADALSDSTALFLTCTAVWTATNGLAMRDGQWVVRRGWMAACGVFSGLALVARSEALVLPAGVALALAWQVRRSFDSQSRRAWLLGSACCALGWTAILAPYLAAGGATTPKAAFERLMGGRRADETTPLNRGQGSSTPLAQPWLDWRLADGQEMSFARKEQGRSSRRTGLAAGAAEFGREWAGALEYWGALLAVAGVWLARRATPTFTGRLVGCHLALLSLAALSAAARTGYLSERHLLPLVVVSGGWAGLALVRLDCVARRRLARAGWRAPRRSLLAAAVCMAACLPGQLVDPHKVHANHRQAAVWLADHARPPDKVLDARGWTALYTGLETYRYELAREALADTDLAYIVVTGDELTSSSLRSRTLRALLTESAEQAAVFPAVGATDRAGVSVYRWHPHRFAELRNRLHAR